MNMKRVQVLGLTVLLSFCLTSGKGAITCTIPTVSAGDGTNVTCNFPQDIRISKNNIKVQRQPFKAENSASDKPVNVLECHWLDQQTINCDAQPGYKLIGQVSNRAVVEIPIATRDHEGKYTCEVVPSEPSDIHPCYFHLKEEVNAADVNNRLSQVLDDMVELRHVVAKGAQEQKSLVSAVLALSLICIVAIVVAVLLYVFKQRVRKCLQRGKLSTKPRPTEETGEETDPLLVGSNAETTVKHTSETADPSKQTQAIIKSQENDEVDKKKETKDTSEKNPAPGGSPKSDVLATVPPLLETTTDTASSPIMHAATDTAQNPHTHAASGSAADTERKTQDQSPLSPPVQVCAIGADGVGIVRVVDAQTTQMSESKDKKPHVYADKSSKAKSGEGKCTLL